VGRIPEKTISSGKQTQSSSPLQCQDKGNPRTLKGQGMRRTEMDQAEKAEINRAAEATLDDLNLEEFVAEGDEDTGQAETEAPESELADEGQATEGEAPEEPETVTMDNLLKVTGFKDAKSLTKTLKEQHATITKKSQREKELESEINELRAIVGQVTSQSRPPAQAGQGEDFDENELFENPKKVIDARVEQLLAKKLQEQQVQQDITAVKSQNPQRFEILRRGGFIEEAYNRRPELGHMGRKGLELAVSEAGKIMKEYYSNISTIINDDGTVSGSAGENEQQIRERLLAEQDRAKSATITGGRPVRETSSNNQSRIAKLTKEGKIEDLADILLDGF